MIIERIYIHWFFSFLLLPVTPVLSQETGPVVITEFMADPASVSDANGEWLEIYNTSDSTINLKGWIIRDSGINDHMIEEDLILPPHAYRVLGRNADTLSNGGVPVDYEYQSFLLDNVQDEILLMRDSLLIDSVGYDPMSNISSGRSLSLSIHYTDYQLNNIISNWCQAEYSYGQGDLGTPGSGNRSCRLSSGELVITEVMTNPAQVHDVDGEWLEVYNAASWPLGLEGLFLQDLDGDSHRIDQPLGIAPGSFLILGRNADSLSNGGVKVDYEYDGFILSNTTDEIILSTQDEVIDQVFYNNTEFPLSNGRSMSLDPEYMSSSFNDAGYYWCRSSEQYGTGDRGTPGMINESCGELPVELVHWEARVEEDAIALYWETASEEENLYFLIEKSHDGMHFERLHTVFAKESAVHGASYRLKDKHPAQGFNYYRLGQRDVNGAFTELGTVAVEFRRQGPVFYPNPASNQVFLAEASVTILNLTDLQGCPLPFEVNQTVLDVAHLSPGIYLMQLSYNGHFFMETLIIH